MMIPFIRCMLHITPTRLWCHDTKGDWPPVAISYADIIVDDMWEETWEKDTHLPPYGDAPSLYDELGLSLQKEYLYLNVLIRMDRLGLSAQTIKQTVLQYHGTTWEEIGFFRWVDVPE